MENRIHLWQSRVEKTEAVLVRNRWNFCVRYEGKSVDQRWLAAILVNPFFVTLLRMYTNINAAL